MPTAEQIQEAIREVTDQRSFIDILLRDTLGWPLELGFDPDIGDITYEWTDDELNTVGLSRDILSGPVLQMQSLEQEREQPWGIFILDFAHEAPFVTGRGLTGPLRKVLRGLVPKRRNRQANLPAWDRENLLFICTHQYKHFRFAYFKAPKDSKLAPLTTFGWGPDTPVRTACEFNLPSLVWPDDARDSEAWLAQWHGAFDKEKLTKDFFKIFAELYHKVVDDIEEIPELKSKARRLAQLLFDRMLFLYFLQRKGWLNEERDYLYTRFIQCWKADPDAQSYYSSVLYPLFLSLSNSDFVDDIIGAVPFLNGGLFEEAATQSQTEQIAHARLHVKNSTFKLIFDELLERFNFTATEDTPLDVEVAIDPEMLGKIFESLILQLEKNPDEDLRRLTGSYYTPRAIVHFMCQQALKEYLKEQLAGNDKSSTDLIIDKMGQLLDLPEADQMNHEQLEILKGLITSIEAKVLRQAILNCQVCDSAVGSGAFLVGMLHEMVAAIGRLDLLIYGQEMLAQRNYYYDIKKQIVESCLYGVDIQEQAVRLCELRLWLSLVVDYELDPDKSFAKAIREVPSLPNLSYRIMRGDSLLERLFGHIIQLDIMAKDARSKQLIESIQADKQAYFREGDNEEKRGLELKILAKQAELAERLIEAKTFAAGVQGDFWGKDAITTKAQKEKVNQEARKKGLTELREKVARAKVEIERLASYKKGIDRCDIDTLRRQHFHTGDNPTFLWHVDFAEVFKEKGGFDVVIGNPPWVFTRVGDFDADVKKHIGENYLKNLDGSQKGRAKQSGKINLYAVFLLQALKILREGGFLSYIIPNTLLRATVYDAIRKFLLDNSTITTIVDLSSGVFAGVTASTVVLSLQNRASSQNHETRIIQNFGAANNLALNDIPQSNFLNNISYTFNIYANNISDQIVAKLHTDACRLDEDFDILAGGIATGPGKKNYISDRPLSSQYKPLIEGKDIKKYKITFKDRYILYDRKKLYRARDESVFLAPEKLVTQRIGGSMNPLIVAYDDEQFYTFNSTNSILPKSNAKLSAKYLLALLNSRLLNWYYVVQFTNKSTLTVNISKTFLEQLPIKRITFDEQKAFIDIVDNVLDITKAEDYLTNSNKQAKAKDFVRQIDQRIYKLYYLTEEEITVVEK